MAEPILPPNERMGAVQVATAVLMVLPVLLPQSRIGCVHAVIAAPIGLAMPDTVAAMLPPQPSEGLLGGADGSLESGLDFRADLHGETAQ